MMLHRVSFVCRADETRLRRMIQDAAYREGLEFNNIKIESQRTYEDIREQELVERVNTVVAEALKPIQFKLDELDRRTLPEDFMD